MKKRGHRSEPAAMKSYLGVEIPPADDRERVWFCLHYGDKFTGDNHDEACRYAAFAVYYTKAMKLGPWAEVA